MKFELLWSNYLWDTWLKSSLEFLILNNLFILQMRDSLYNIDGMNFGIKQTSASIMVLCVHGTQGLARSFKTLKSTCFFPTKVIEILETFFLLEENNNGNNIKNSIVDNN